MSSLHLIVRGLVFLAQLIAHPLGGFPNTEVTFDAETEQFISDYRGVFERYLQIILSLYGGYPETIQDALQEVGVELEQLSDHQLLNFSGLPRDIYLLNVQISAWGITEDELDAPNTDIPEDADETTRSRHMGLLYARMLHMQIEARFHMNDDQSGEPTSD